MCARTQTRSSILVVLVTAMSQAHTQSHLDLVEKKGKIKKRINAVRNLIQSRPIAGPLIWILHGTDPRMSTRQDTENPSDLTAYLFFERKKRKRWRAISDGVCFISTRRFLWGWFRQLPWKRFPNFSVRMLRRPPSSQTIAGQKGFFVQFWPASKLRVTQLGGGGEYGSKLMKF